MKMKWLLIVVTSIFVPVTSAVADSHESAEVTDEAKDASKAEKKENKFGEVSIKEVQDALAKNAVTVIDANGIGKYDTGHIAGSLHFASMEPEVLAKALPEDKAALIVTYCAGPTWNAWKKVAVAAKKLGYTNIKAMRAGISGWSEAGADVEKSDKKADKKLEY